MKITRLLVAVSFAGILAVYSVAQAAPVDSVESARASSAFQKVDAFLSEKAVVAQMQALGFATEQAHARLARLSDSQVEQLAAQVDLIKAGGTIKGGQPNPLGPFSYMLRNIGTFVTNVFRVLFSWRDLK